MEILDVINFHWIVVVVTGLYTHLRQICIIGFCIDAEDPSQALSFDHTYASTIFLSSVLLLLAEYQLWPRSLKEPPVQLLFIYEILVAALVTNLTMSLIWMPLMHSVLYLTSEANKWLLWLYEQPGVNNVAFIETIANYLSTEQAASHTALCLSILSFLWMLDATESLEGIFDMIKNDSSFPPEFERRVAFAEPEATIRYFYTGCKRWYNCLFNKLDS